MTGARTRLVWDYAVIAQKSSAWDAVSAKYGLMGFDTAEGAVRVIQPGPASYANPCISPDGETVFFTDQASKTIYAVNWDGTGKREISKGYGLCTWRNQADGTQWLFFTAGGYESGPVVRCRIDDPSVRKTVWTGAQASHTLTVSADGTHAGSEWPWPIAGVAVFPDVGWKQYGNGCNASIAPDNSYRFFHMGEEIGHGGVTFYDDGGINRRVIHFNNFDEHPRAASWAPRWTNDVRFLTVNHPIGGEESDPYIGKFNDSFTAVEKWVRISNQPGHDAKVCGWIDPGLGSYSGEAPFTLEVPAWRTGGKQFAWDWGDGTKETAATARHTYTAAGSYIITARRNGTETKGRVEVSPRKAPAVASVLLFDEKTLQIAFDERASVAQAELSFESGTPISKFSLDGEKLRLIVETEKAVPDGDTLRIKGIHDRAQMPNSIDASVVVERPAWPPNREGLVFLHGPAERDDFHWNPSNNLFEANTLRTSGLARQNRHNALMLDGGTISIPDGARGAYARSRQTNEVSIEAVVSPFNIYQGNDGMPSEILVCGESWGVPRSNLVLGQAREKLVLYLRVTSGNRGEMKRFELCDLEARTPRHILISISADTLTCYVDGKKLTEASLPEGGIRWREPDFAHGLHLGGWPGRTAHSWRGVVEGIAIYDSVKSAAEAASHYAAYRRILGARPTPPQHLVEAKLIAKSDIPNASDIAPYRDALVINEYDVLEVIQGGIQPGKLRVVQWGLLDTHPTKLASVETGTRHRLILEPYAGHPELQGEYKHDTLEPNFDLDLYVDVTHGPSDPPRAAKITVHPGELWLPPHMKQQFSVRAIDQYGNPLDAPELKWSCEPGGELNLGTAYGAGQWFDAHKAKGSGTIDATGLFTPGREGAVTIKVAAAENPEIGSQALVGIGDWPAINPATRLPLRIGMNNDLSRGFSGDIDRVRIYNRALSSSEIAKHARGGELGSEGLVGDWPLDKKDGDVFPNVAGEGLEAKPIHVDPRKKVEHIIENGNGFVRLNGGGYLEVAPDKRLDISESCTLEAWLRPEGGGVVFSRQQVWMWGFIFLAHPNGLSIDALRTGGAGSLSGSYEFGDGWTHIAGVLDVNGHWQLFANGKLVAEKKEHRLIIRD